MRWHVGVLLSPASVRETAASFCSLAHRESNQRRLIVRSSQGSFIDRFCQDSVFNSTDPGVEEGSQAQVFQDSPKTHSSQQQLAQYRTCVYEEGLI